jgi:hypothetical protein
MLPFFEWVKVPLTLLSLVLFQPQFLCLSDSILSAFPSLLQPHLPLMQHRDICDLSREANDWVCAPQELKGGLLHAHIWPGVVDKLGKRKKVCLVVLLAASIDPQILLHPLIDVF